ncbi:hemolysin III family protein [Treponema zuelzerae]|uniref:Hemolysin III family protein n=1 Tax=Teretinema zuelzerae TaxID=156 RepID=A0AAE3EK29_9SPIR|nr:hemolysin III family protein [Teretinema zuelzerae]MBN2811006.1 hemolysin III family protein [Spirochaetales bacterium]MCD1656169.1 hemolysin III family protein [Teretinema zuelzerae]
MNKLPKPYRLSEEIANAITHGIAAFLSIAGLVILITRAVLHAPEGETAYYVTAFSIFGFSMVFLYLMSTLYHSLLKTKAYSVFERLDHSAIYVLIAGTYTAYCLTALRGTVGWWIFGIIWGLAAAGISLYAVFGSKLRYISLFTYIGMGWIIVFAADPLKAVVSEDSWVLLLAGGIVYTVGAGVYALKKIKWTHPVWHLFVMGGTILHFFSILKSF